MPNATASSLRTPRPARALRWASLAALLWAFGGGAWAESNGINGFSGKQGFDCSSCHFGGSFSRNATITTSGSIVAGRATTLTATMGTNASRAGFNLAIEFGTSDDGMPDDGTLTAGTGGVLIELGEATHTSPGVVSGGQKVWTVGWTPASSGLHRIFMCSQGVDLNGSTSGDGPPSCTTKDVTVQANTAPNITSPSAGQNFNVALGSSLSGVDVAATDSQGSEGSEFTYSLTTAPSGMSINASTGVISWTPSATQVSGASTAHSVTVRAADIGGLTDSVSFTVTVTNSAPSANAGVDITRNEGTLVTLAGSASDANGASTISSQSWARIAGLNVTLSGATTLTPSFTAPNVAADATVTLRLTVTDSSGLSATDDVVVTVAQVNAAPSANAGPEQSVIEGALVTLDSSASADSDADGLGSLAGRSWAQVGGSPAVTLSNASAVMPTFTAPNVAPGGASLTFEVTVTDNNGATDSDTVVITVADVNNAPTANAGPDQSVTEGAAVSLDGSASSDNDADGNGAIDSFSWVQTVGTAVTLSGANTAAPTFTAPNVGPAGGSLTFELTVTDNGGLTATDTVVVTVADNNVGPTASAGPDQTVNEGSVATLDSSASADGDGDSLGGIASRAWTQQSGTAVTLSDASAEMPTFTAPNVPPAGETLVFRVTVTDTGGLTDFDEVSITIADVNAAPTANAGVDQTRNEGAPVNLDGSLSADNDADGNGAIAAFAWVQTAGATASLTGADTATPSFTAPSVPFGGDVLTFQLTVTDNGSLTATDSVNVTVNDVNVAPTANAGVDQTVNENATVNLNGSASSDADGSIATYAWVQTAGTAVSLTDATVPTPSFTAPSVAPAGETLTFELTVTDDAGDSASDTVVISVSDVNVLPTANAGSDQTVSEGATVTLDGSASADSDGSIASFSWAQTGGSTVTLTGANSATPMFAAPAVAPAGEALTFELTVTDDAGDTGTDTVVISVSDVNAAPSANAGPDQSVAEGASVSLDGSLSADNDADGNGAIASFAWAEIGGSAVTLSGADSATPSFTAPNVAPAGGSVTLQLTVTDNGGLTATDTVVVTVADVNAAPTAAAGGDQSVDEGTSVTLNGSASADNDADGNGAIDSFAWAQTAGTPAMLSGAGTPTPSFTAPEVGLAGDTLVFELTVTDNGGLTASDTVAVMVANVNKPPVADAGGNQLVNENVSVSLDGSASSDPDGSIASFAWVQTAGTPSVSLSGANTATPSFTSPTVGAGGTALTFELTVTDDGTPGLSAVDTVIVNVSNVLLAPTAAAGPDQTVAEGSSVTLDGGASSDSDGTIASFAWAQTGGPVVPLTGADTATPQFAAPSVAPAGTALTFELTVIDNDSLSDTDSVVVTVADVNADPSADAGPDQSVSENTPVTLDSSASTDNDADGLGGIDSRNWVQTAGTAVTLSDASAVSPTFSAPPVSVAGDTLTFEVTVTDNGGASAADTVDIAVTDVNTSPMANAGADQNVSEGDTVTLTGAGSVDPDAPLDAIVSFAWVQTGGTAVTLSDANVSMPTFTAPLVPVGGEALTFTVTVTDQAGASDSDAVIVNVSDVNTPPVASAGADITTVEDTLVVLDGTASNDPDAPLGNIVSFQWTQDAGDALQVTLDDPSSQTPSFTAPAVPAAGVSLTFTLRVTDDAGAMSDDAVLVTVSNVNQPPTASAGPDQMVNEGDAVSLDGSASSDPDPDGSIATFVWVQTGGTAVTLSGNTTASPSFAAPSVGVSGDTLTFELTVLDDLGLQATDTVSVAVADVNVAPLADAGPDQSVSEGALVTLDASASSDPDAPLGSIVGFAWVQTAGTAVVLSDAGASMPTFTAPNVAPGGTTVSFDVTVTDDAGDSATDSVVISVNDVNADPTAAAGADLSVNEGASVQLDGSGSADNDADGLGAIASFAWVQIGGPSAALSGADTATPTFIAPLVNPAGAVLSFRLTATDNGGATATDTVDVTVLDVNVAPTANAGSDQMVSENVTVNLDGSASSDADGVIAAFAWTQSVGTAVTLSGATTATPSFAAPEVGVAGETLSFDLTVTDDAGSMATDSVDINVVNVNASPIANAGADQQVTEGDGVALDGSGSSDADGSIAAFAWTQSAGTAVTLSGADTATPGFTAPTPAGLSETLTFDLTVTDDLGDTGSDSVDVRVSVANLPPTADAGPDQTVTEGTLVTLDAGNSSDGDGSVVTFAWLQTSGSAVSLSDAAAAAPTFLAPATGVAGEALTFEVTVTDDGGASDSDVVIVNVSDINVPPIADAGVPVRQVRPGDSVTLDGSNSRDGDAPLGSIVAFAWTQAAGDPLQVALSDAAAQAPTFVAPDVDTAGATLRFTLLVTDDAGAMDDDEVLVNVSAGNLPPLADAGLAQTVAPGTSVRLDGSNSFDPDGSIVQFNWQQIDSSGESVALTSASLAKPRFTAPSPAAGQVLALTFRLTVTDDLGLQSTALGTVNVVADAIDPPLADAGAAQSVAVGDLVTLDGSASFDPSGGSLAFEWSQLSGPAVQLSDPESAQPTFTAPTVDPAGAQIGFRLSVTSDAQLVASDSTVVTIAGSNQVPSAVVDAPASVSEGETVSLDGSNSSDPDGAVSAYRWSQIAGPRIAFSDPNGTTTSFVAPSVNAEESPVALRLVLSVTDDGPGVDGPLSDRVEFEVLVNDNGVAGFDDADVALIGSEGGSVGITAADTADIVEIRAVDPESIDEQTNRPTSFGFGLFDFMLRVDLPGGATTIEFELDAPAPEGATWVKFSPTGGWSDFGDNAVFSADRRSVRLTLVDGGAGDDDGAIDGLIRDPSGIGTLPAAAGGENPPAETPAAGDNAERRGGGCSVSPANGGVPGGIDAMLLLLLLGSAAGGLWRTLNRRAG